MVKKTDTYKKLIIICILCIMLTACSDKEGTDTFSEEALKTKVESSGGSNEETDSTAETVKVNVSDEEGQEKIINILNELQENEYLADFNFFEQNMYVLTEAEKGVILRKYNMDTWEVISAITEIDNGYFELRPYSSGVVVKRNPKYNYEYNYIFDENLNMIGECEGIMTDYSAKFGMLYYYNKDENKIYGKKTDNGEISVIREFMNPDEFMHPATIEKDEIVSIEDIAVSTDGNYIFYKGQCWEEDGTKDIWGYFDIRNAENDVMYKENKKIKAGENSVIVTDTDSGQYMMGQEPVLSKEYCYFDNGVQRNERQFGNADESGTGKCSCEGNLLITNFYEDTAIVTVYDIINNNIIGNYRGNNLDWITYGNVCEKFKIILCKNPIHESPEVFSPTGKFEILWVTY